MRRLLEVCAIVPALAFAADTFGQESEYYLGKAEGGHIWVIQGGEVIREWDIANGTLEIPFTVTDMVRTYGYMPGHTGSEYELDGNYTGNTFPWVDGCGSFYLDGATDGEFAYAVQFTGVRPICRFDMDWTNPELLFNLPGGEQWDAITYDPSDGTMWATGRNRVLAQFEMDGSEVQRFTIPVGNRAAALALDPADGTFWMHRGGDIIQQYSKDGELLTTHNVAGVSGNIWGGEFQFGRGGGCDPCDANCDGSVDLTDVEDFIKLMLGGDPCDFCSGDTNDDGSIDLTDVEGFLECLLG